MTVWSVQSASVKPGGVVIAPSKFSEKNGGEVLATGYNNSKGFEAVAIGRVQHYLFWGFFASPAQMNTAGKNLFINSILYIKSFQGQH
ncbi:MAG: hypothetical protein V1799_06180 [bacterium]